MNRHLNPAAIFVGLLFMAAASVVAVDATSAWDLAPAVLWPAVFLGWGITLLLRALPASQRSGGPTTPTAGTTMRHREGSSDDQDHAGR